MGLDHGEMNISGGKRPHHLEDLPPPCSGDHHVGPAPGTDHSLRFQREPVSGAWGSPRKETNSGGWHAVFS